MPKLFPRIIGLCVLFLLTFVASESVFAQSNALKNDLKKSFTKVNVVRFNEDAALRRAEGEKVLSVPTGDKTFELNLTPRDMRAAHYRAENETMAGTQILARGEVNTFKGKVSGDADSQVRLTVEDSQIEGFFISGSEKYFIEPARNYSPYAAAEDSVVYRPQDVLNTKSYTCLSELGDKIEKGKQMVSLKTVEALQGLRVIKLATEADYEYVLSTGGANAANSKILSILNMVEGVYETELGLTISVVFQHTWTTPDPLNATGADALLRSFQAYWNENYSKTQIERDAAHLFTAKPAVLAQGFAFQSVICRPVSAGSPDVSYGLSGRIPVEWDWEAANFLVTAHELGHNIGASHSESQQSCANSLMNAALNNDTQLSFCSFSRTEITNYVSGSGACLTTRIAAAANFDFDGDKKSDISIWRPANGGWYIDQSSGGQKIFGFGVAGDKPVAADYDGDGKADAAVFRNGVWYRLKTGSNTFDAVNFGLPTDIPSPADYDGDGKTDVAVYRQSTGTWYISASTAGTIIRQFGNNTDVPAAADYDGDGKADIAIYRASKGEWWINRSAAGTIAFQFGFATDKPVQSDYTGDGKADVAIFRPGTGEWFVLRSEDSSYYSFPFGINGDMPTPGDYDGDGKTDAAVFRPSGNTWFVQRSSAGTMIQTFGQEGDNPVPNSYVR